MKRTILAVAIVLALVVPSIAYAVDKYQATGPVTDFEKDKSITILKGGKEKHEFTIDKDTKISGDVKKDSKVEVKFKMVATSIEVKDEAKKGDKKESKKKS
jgi:hypothetical protein